MTEKEQLDLILSLSTEEKQVLIQLWKEHKKMFKKRNRKKVMSDEELQTAVSRGIARTVETILKAAKRDTAAGESTPFEKKSE